MNKAKDKINANRLERFIAVLIVVGVVLGAFYAFATVRHLTGKKEVAALLPLERTIGYVEFSDLDLPAKLMGSGAFTPQAWEALINGWFGVDYFLVSPSWATKAFGVALVDDGKGSSQPVFFAETGGRRQTLKAFEKISVGGGKLVAEGPSKKAIYSFPQGPNVHLALVNSYVFMARESAPLEAIQAVTGDTQSVLSNPDHRTTMENLPRQSWLRGYVNVHAVHFNDNFALNNMIEPLKFAVNHAALTVKKSPNGFHFNTFANLNKNLLSLKDSLTEKKKFGRGLADFIHQDGLAVYLGGENLSVEWQNTLETIANLNPAYGLILEGILRSQTTKVFGDDVDLRNDLYPLFEGEYALGVGQKEGARQIRLLLTHSDKAFAEAKLAKLLKGFQYLASQFTPKLHVVTLPDGTESRELVANDERPREKTEDYNDSEVHCVEVTDSANAFCYAVLADFLVMANNRENVVQAIDLNASPTLTLSKFLPYRQTLNNVAKVSDEITFVDISNLLPMIEANPYILLMKPTLDQFEATAWVKHYFEDGVSAEGYLLLK